MIKVIGFAKKRADMTRQQFKDYWLNQHSRLEGRSLQTNPVKRIVANFVEEDLVGQVPFDGMVELYFDSMEDFRKQWSSGHDEEMKQDEMNFCDTSSRMFFMVTEVDIGAMLEERAKSR
jgi:uncharacterized protein (TIGR02118 family)